MRVDGHDAVVATVRLPQTCQSTRAFDRAANRWPRALRRRCSSVRAARENFLVVCLCVVSQSKMPSVPEGSLSTSHFAALPSAAAASFACSSRSATMPRKLPSRTTLMTPGIFLTAAVSSRRAWPHRSADVQPRQKRCLLASCPARKPLHQLYCPEYQGAETICRYSGVQKSDGASPCPLPRAPVPCRSKFPVGNSLAVGGHDRSIFNFHSVNGLAEFCGGKAEQYLLTSADACERRAAVGHRLNRRYAFIPEPAVSPEMT